MNVWVPRGFTRTPLAHALGRAPVGKEMKKNNERTNTA